LLQNVKLPGFHQDFTEITWISPKLPGFHQDFTDQDFTEFDVNANHFQLLDRKSAKVLDGKCSLFCGPVVGNHCYIAVYFSIIRLIFSTFDLCAAV